MEQQPEDKCVVIMACTVDHSILLWPGAQVGTWAPELPLAVWRGMQCVSVTFSLPRRATWSSPKSLSFAREHALITSPITHLPAARYTAIYMSSRYDPRAASLSAFTDTRTCLTPRTGAQHLRRMKRALAQLVVPNAAKRRSRKDRSAARTRSRSLSLKQ